MSSSMSIGHCLLGAFKQFQILHLLVDNLSRINPLSLLLPDIVCFV